MTGVALRARRSPPRPRTRAGALRRPRATRGGERCRHPTRRAARPAPRGCRARPAHRRSRSASSRSRRRAAETEHRRQKRRWSARARAPRAARRKVRAPDARRSTGLCSHGVNAPRGRPRGSTSASRSPCGSTSDSTRSPKRVSIGFNLRAVFLQPRCPSSRGCPAAPPARLRRARPCPIRGGAICAHGKNVRSVPGWPSASA